MNQKQCCEFGINKNVGMKLRSWSVGQRSYTVRTASLKALIHYMYRNVFRKELSYGQINKTVNVLSMANSSKKASTVVLVLIHLQ